MSGHYAVQLLIKLRILALTTPAAQRAQVRLSAGIHALV